MSRMLTFFGVVGGADGTSGTANRSAALRFMDGFLSRCDLPSVDAARLHRIAAMAHLEAQRYGRARRHLLALARLQPECALTQHLLGQAYETDPYGCDLRAARSYRRAVKLNAREPKYRAALGRALVRVNSIGSGVKVLCKAAKAAPTDTEVMEVVADGLREAGQAGVAFRLLSHAIFLAPASRELKRLWNRARFDMAVERQKGKQLHSSPEKPKNHAKMVPFIRIADTERQTAANEQIRHDVPSRPAPHFLRLRPINDGNTTAEPA